MMKPRSAGMRDGPVRKPGKKHDTVPVEGSSRTSNGQPRQHSPGVPFPTAIDAGKRHPLRLKLKPKGAVAGHVDGAWWPRSLDLSAELPALVEVLAVRLGRVERVSYHLAAWDAAPRRIGVGRELLRLGGFRAQNPHTVDVIAGSGPRVTLLVVPPGTDAATAHRVLLRAGRRDNAESADELLTRG
jgi:hypothetical protein